MAEENNIEKKDTVYHQDAVIDIYPRVTFGRRPILTPYTEVTEDNVRRILSAAAATFAVNRAECEGLYQYYKGKQPILGRIKMERPEIKNIVIENRAYEIVTFKTGRFLYKDILYTNHTDDKDSAKINDVNELNRIMASDGKAGKDRELVDLFHICGHAYRMIVDSSDEGFPFHTYTIDPRRAFVVYSVRLRKADRYERKRQDNVARMDRQPHYSRASPADRVNRRNASKFLRPARFLRRGRRELRVAYADL